MTRPDLPEHEIEKGSRGEHDLARMIDSRRIRRLENVAAGILEPKLGKGRHGAPGVLESRRVGDVVRVAVREERRRIGNDGVGRAVRQVERNVSGVAEIEAGGLREPKSQHRSGRADEITPRRGAKIGKPRGPALPFEGVRRTRAVADRREAVRVLQSDQERALPSLREAGEVDAVRIDPERCARVGQAGEDIGLVGNAVHAVDILRGIRADRGIEAALPEDHDETSRVRLGLVPIRLKRGHRSPSAMQKEHGRHLGNAVVPGGRQNLIETNRAVRRRHVRADVEHWPAEKRARAENREEEEKEEPEGKRCPANPSSAETP